MIRTAGVVVLYNPPQTLPQNIGSYLHGLELLYVFDNSPGRCGEVVDSVRHLEKIEYLTTGSNVGIPSALNAAARKSIERGCEFLLTMDQDSCAGQGMISTMLDAAAHDPSVGLIAPFHVGPRVRDTPPEPDVEAVVAAMTSGSLIRLRAYQEVGGFMEELFIDYVDYEYCLRLQERGYSVVRANRAKLVHKLGESVPKRLFGREIQVTNHSPARFFYQTRNRRLLRRRYGERFPEFFKQESQLQRGRLLKMLLYERNRFRKCVMVLRGMVAAWRNDLSSIPMS
ncbi:MAG: glycosyltransferase family 2 protein [Ignavibacteriales bacterium]|nr:glycosyltransferase family 2 protein [Ignavibacteriales bacterium]